MVTGFLILLTSITLNDLELPKDGVFSKFLAIFGCNAHFKSKLQRNA